MKNFARWIVGAALSALFLVAACRDKPPVEAGHQVHLTEPETAPISVTLTSEGAATAHIKTDPAAPRALSRRVSAAGELEFNARRIVHLTARTPGRVERVVVVRGDRVREGQILAEIYCPDYLILQAEYLMAAERAKRQSGDPAEAGPARALLDSSRERLLLLGATPAEVDGLGALSVPRPLLPVRATLSGTVLEAGVLAGGWVDLGADLFRLADLTNLWACLHIQEKDLSSVKAGAEAVLRTQAYPGEDFRGRLVLVGDIVDAGTRTVEGRVEVPNPSGRLKPGMYVEASVATAGERAVIAVPEAALQDDEGRAVVFVKTGERTFERREVEAGERFAGYVEILSGLAEGETVVTSGGFLLKSEMRKGGMEDEHGHDRTSR
jgi:multidrug efflux pump subunit AcrA (membrane-fusion protein)